MQQLNPDQTPIELLDTWARLEGGLIDANRLRIEELPSITQPPSCAALDQANRRHLLIPLTADGDDMQLEATRAISVATRKLVSKTGRPADIYMDLACQQPTLVDTFASLCAEILGELRVSENEVQTVVASVLDRWRRLLAETTPPTGLSAAQLLGLFGELMILEDFIHLDGSTALTSWTGPDRARRDFTGPNSGWSLEVKTTQRREGWEVTIHGIDQLSLRKDKDLALVILKLEARPDGTSLPELVDRLRDRTPQPAEFLKKLEQAGYRDEDRSLYGRPLLAELDRRYYRVTSAFPRIAPESFPNQQVPHGVSRVQYRIDLNAPTPEALSPRDIDEYLSGLLQRA